MKNLTAYAAFAVLGVLIGLFAARFHDRGVKTMPGAGDEAEREILYWVAPMDPNFRRDGPGKSPMGMDLVPVYRDETSSGGGVVNIDPTVLQNMGVRSTTAQIGSLPRLIETVGYVEYDENTLFHVHTRVDGWIEKLAATASGDPVKQGELLFELYSPDLVNAQQEYLAALRSSNDALIQASRERLIALGMTPAQVSRVLEERTVSQRVRFYAQSDGVIAYLGVREGFFVTPATEVMSIASLDQVWVLAEVFERQAAWVQPGQTATVTLDYLPGRRLDGLVDYVYPELDPTTRTLRVRLKFENVDTFLRPNMFARVVIEGRPTGDIVHVPREAVIRGARLNRVVLDLGGGRFRSQPVVVGVESADRVAIRSGLTGDERVVVSGQFLIDSESNIGSALDRFDPAMGGDQGDSQ